MKNDMNTKREQIKALRKCGLPANRQKDYWKKEERQMLQDMCKRKIEQYLFPYDRIEKKGE